MATWRCPHCRTVQVEGPRCFLCNRSATSCGTCVNFRRAVVGGLGYCAWDKQREPLTGEEQRPCWSSAAVPAAEGLFGGSLPTAEPAPPRALGARRLKDQPRTTGRLVELKPSPPLSGS